MLIIIYRNEDNPIIRKQLASDFQTGIYHIEPVSVKATVGLGVALHRVEHLVALSIKCPTSCLVFVTILCKVIVIHEVITRVIRWVNVDHLDSTQIIFTQDFEDFEVVALDIKVFRIETSGTPIPTYTFFGARAQGHGAWRISQTSRSLFVRPRELVSFFAFAHDFVGQFCPQLIKVYCIYGVTPPI